ncbi:MAG: DMT family transporter [Geitlerinemataceae cyanobacterium]
MLSNLTALRNRIPGRAYLLAAVIIFAASNTIVRILTDIGAENPIDGRNPISFCNVLFVGNLVVLMVLSSVYRSQLNRTTFAKLTKLDWGALLVVALLSGALAPALVFMALDLTTVNNVVLLGRIEPPLALILSIAFLGDRVGALTLVGSAISFFGVALTVLLPSGDSAMAATGGLMVGRGEIYALSGAIVAAISTIFTRTALKNVPIGIFAIVRTMIGAAVFFVVVLILFEPGHFMDVFSPFLWQWMLVYGGLVIVGGQLCWFTGLKVSVASEVSLASSFAPIAGVLAAFLLLGEAPTTAQYIGGAVIVIGIVCTQIDVQRRSRQPRPTATKELDIGVGFKGTS